MMVSFDDLLKNKKPDFPQLMPKLVDETGNQTTERDNRIGLTQVTFNGKSIEDEPKRKTSAELRQEQKNRIIEEHGGISNIPMNSKYWKL
jgi:hypothetical protein